MAAPMRRRCLVGGCALRVRAAPAVVPSGYAARSMTVESGLVAPPARVPFWNLVNRRRSEASRSVLFHFLEHERCQDLIAACRAHGDVSRCIYISAPSKHLALVEFAKIQYLQSFMHCVQPCKSSKKLLMPARTRMVTVPKEAKMRRNSWGMAASKQSGGHRCTVEVGSTDPVSALDLTLHSSIDDQIQALYAHHRQTELSTRLRFFICSVLEETLCGSFLPTARVRPFGSSVSGLGQRDTDLDMNLLLHEPLPRSASSTKERSKESDREERDDGRYFHYVEKVYHLNEEQRVRDRLLKLVFGVISTCLPHVEDIMVIPAARVPIVKFRHALTRFECDLSLFTSYGTAPGSLGMAASEMLYILGEADTRFRPLTFAVRFWAKENDITSNLPGPTPHLTNFQLTLLVVHFLQMKRVLPSVQALVVPPAAGCEYAHGQNYSFLSDYSRLPSSDNQQSVGELFEEFFHYYATFDFSTNGISVLSRSLPTKDKKPAMLIVNPQEPSLNVSKNVNLTELCRLQKLCKASADILEASRSPSLGDVLKLKCIE